MKFTPFSYSGRYGPPGALFTPTKETINGIEECIRWAEYEVPSKLPITINTLAFYMAVTNQGQARAMSFGPHDPQGRNAAAAWQIPVRQITQRYYLGWKVRPLIRRREIVAWQLYNNVREAYFIEFGISRVGFGGDRHVPARRIRRPILKISLLRTLRVLAQTEAYHRIWSNLMVHRGKGYGFTQIVQAPGGGHSMFAPWGMNAANEGSGSFSGPMLGRRLP